MTDADIQPLEEPAFHEILTERLRLRTIRVSDAAGVLPMVEQEDVMYWTSRGRAIQTIEETERWLKDRALGKDVFNFAIELRDKAAMSPDVPIVGIAGSFRPAEIGYMVHPIYAGKGYSTEAAKAIIPEMFKRFPPASEGGIGFDYLEAWTATDNRASQRILEKCGFTFCETSSMDTALRGNIGCLIYRIARPGKTLEELGLLPGKDDASSAPTPPVQ